MSMKDQLFKIYEKIRPDNGFGWNQLIVGAFVGMLIAVIFQPYLAAFVTDKKVALNAPGYKEPKVDVSVDKMYSNYPEGAQIEDFEGLIWKEEYSLYRVKIRNTASKSVSNLELLLRLPGCSRYTNLEGPGISGDVDSSDYIQPRITYDLEPPEGYENRLNTLGCTKKIEISNLPSNELRSVEYVVTRDFSRCDLIIGYEPTSTYDLTYQWRADSETYQVQSSNQVSDLSEDYKSARSPGGVGIQTVLRTEGRDPTFAYLVNVSSSSLNQGVKQCVFTPVDNNATSHS